MLEAQSQRQPTQPDTQHDVFEQARWINRFSRKKKQPGHPAKRFNHGSVVHEGYLYIIGGANTNTDKPIDTFTVYRMDIENSEWQILPEAGTEQPEPMSAFTCCLFENTVVLFGGSDSSNHQNNNLWHYNLVSNTWKKMQQLGDVPQPRESSTAVMLGNVMYLFGGISLSVELIYQDMFLLEVANSKWSRVHSTGDIIPQRTLQAGCTVDGRIYIFGGQYIQYEETCYDDLFEIVLKGTEAVVRSIKTAVRPPGRHSHSLTPLSSQYLVLIGGEGFPKEHQDEEKEEDESTVTFGDVWLFDRIKTNWVKVEPRNPIFKPRSNFSCVEHDGRLIIFGGLRNNNQLYDELLLLELDLDKLATVHNTKLCNNCHQLTAVQELYSVKEQLEMSFHFLQATANLIKFPFAAFGLLIDNCVSIGATTINISILDREDEQDTRIVRQEDKTERGNIMDTLKNPERTIQYILMEDNGRPWGNDEFLRVILKFETVNSFEYQVADKKARASLLRENIKREFGNNLKMGCLRLGKGFLYISYLNGFARVAMLAPKNRPGQEHVYVCHHYIEELATGNFLTAQGTENKAHIHSVCRSILKPTVLAEMRDRNKLYIFELRELQTKQGNFYELNSYRNDLIYGNLMKVEFLEKVGYNIFECPDFSLRAYISLLYLKTETKIHLQTDRLHFEEIVNQMFLEKIDRQKMAGFVKEIDYANEYTELAECKVVELYYNPNLDRRSNLFHSGVLIYHRNRLIFRYKYELGQLFPLKFFRRKYKRTQNNVFQFFGFIELPDGMPYNFIKTEVQHHILMEGFLASLKLILKDIKRKLSRDDVDIGQLGLSKNQGIGVEPGQEVQKKPGVQRPNAPPTDPNQPPRPDQKIKKKEPLIIHLERPEDENLQLVATPAVKYDGEPEKPSEEHPPEQQRPSTMPLEDQNVPIMHIESESEESPDEEEEDEEDASNGEDESDDEEYIGKTGYKVKNYNHVAEPSQAAQNNTEEKIEREQPSEERYHRSAELRETSPHQEDNPRNCQSDMVVEEQQQPAMEEEEQEEEEDGGPSRQPSDQPNDSSKMEAEEPLPPVNEPQQEPREPGQIEESQEEKGQSENPKILKEVIAKRNGIQ